MCIEDYRIGNRKWPRFSIAPAAAATPIRGDGNRVLIRFAGSGDLAGNISATITEPSSGAIVATLRSNAESQVELWLERHGSLVHMPLLITTTAASSAIGITEIILNDQNNSPPPGG